MPYTHTNSKANPEANAAPDPRPGQDAVHQAIVELRTELLTTAEAQSANI